MRQPYHQGPTLEYFLKQISRYFADIRGRQINKEYPRISRKAAFQIPDTPLKYWRILFLNGAHLFLPFLYARILVDSVVSYFFIKTFLFSWSRSTIKKRMILHSLKSLASLSRGMIQPGCWRSFLSCYLVNAVKRAPFNAHGHFYFSS